MSFVFVFESKIYQLMTLFCLITREQIYILRLSPDPGLSTSVTRGMCTSSGPPRVSRLYLNFLSTTPIRSYQLVHPSGMRFRAGTLTNIGVVFLSIMGTRGDTFEHSIAKASSMDSGSKPKAGASGLENKNAAIFDNRIDGMEGKNDRLYVWFVPNT